MIYNPSILSNISSDLFLQGFKFSKHFQPQINYVVVFRWTTQAQFESLAKTMTHHRVVYVVLGRIQEEIASLFSLIDRVITHPTTIVMFQRRSIDSNPIVISAIENEPYIGFEDGHPSGVDLDLIQIIVGKLNKTVHYFVQRIDQNLKLNDYIIRMDRTLGLSRSDGYVAALNPTVSTIMIPNRGSQCVLEPFRNSRFLPLVIVMFLQVIVSLILMYCFPSLFRNDLILLPWFNIESYNLHRTARLERFVMIALIVVAFFTRTVFENTLTSWITNWPTRFEVNSLEELLQSGWKIKTSLSIEREILMEDSRWSNVLQYEEFFYVIHTENVAYLTSEEVFNYFYAIWNDLDLPEKFESLPERLNFGYGMYYFGPQNKLAAQFESIQRRIFDSGIFAYLRHHLEERLKRFIKRHITLGKSNPISNYISYKDLGLTRWILAVGWIASTAVFLSQWVYGRYHSVTRFGATPTCILRTSKRSKRLQRRSKSYPWTARCRRELHRRNSI